MKRCFPSMSGVRTEGHLSNWIGEGIIICPVWETSHLVWIQFNLDHIPKKKIILYLTCTNFSFYLLKINVVRKMSIAFFLTDGSNRTVTEQYGECCNVCTHVPTCMYFHLDICWSTHDECRNKRMCDWICLKCRWRRMEMEMKMEKKQGRSP